MQTNNQGGRTSAKVLAVLLCAVVMAATLISIGTSPSGGTCCGGTTTVPGVDPPPPTTDAELPPDPPIGCGQCTQFGSTGSFTAPESGEIIFGMNDNRYEDNSGSWIITLQEFGSSGTTQIEVPSGGNVSSMPFSVEKGKTYTYSATGLVVWVGNQPPVGPDGLNIVAEQDFACPGKNKFCLIGRFFCAPEDVNLIIYHGQSGAEVAQDVEETIGAFTVANLNDTDGDQDLDQDGISEGRDIDDARVNPVDPAKGRVEVDLMRLIIKKPINDVGGNVKLTVVSGGAKLWAQHIKVDEVVLTGGSVEFPTAELDKTIWVEARSPSSALRDIVLELEYNGKKDRIAATGVWATLSRVRDDRFVNGVDVQLADFLRDFPELAGPPLVLTNLYGGVGLRPSLQVEGPGNAILMEFKLMPPGISQQPNVKFDIGRRVQSFIAEVTLNGRNVEATKFPVNLEDANDDPPAADESETPTASDLFYSFDAPGPIDKFAGLSKRLVLRLSFLEFARVSFNGARPEGNGVHGSRCSDMFAWHVKSDLIVDQNRIWVRPTGDEKETETNNVGPGLIMIQPAPGQGGQ